MRAIIQRVIYARITIDSDGTEDIQWLSNKIVNLRIFDDDAGVMNHSLVETGGELMLVSQFTLFASTKKGNRPSYSRASKPDTAIPIYEAMILQIQKDLGRPIQTGVFAADMKVELLNDGPVTIWMDTKNRE